MKTRTSLLALGLAFIGVVTAVACGSAPKPDLGATTPSVPSAASAEPPSTAGAASAVPAASSAAPAATASAAAPAKMTAADCDKLVDDANVELDAERIKVDKVCKKDADCMVINGRACGFVCPTGAIPKGEEPEWSREVKSVKENMCKKWTENDCAKISPAKPPAKCPEEGKKPACKAGKCILK